MAIKQYQIYKRKLLNANCIAKTIKALKKYQFWKHNEHKVPKNHADVIYNYKKSVQ